MFSKKAFLIFILFLAGFFFLNISSASAETLYFGGPLNNGDWDNYENWWISVDFIEGNEAWTTPFASDDIVIMANVLSNSGAAASVKSITVNGAVHVDIPITVTITGAVFNDTSYNTNTITGNTTYNNTSYNSGIVTGNAIFNDTSYNKIGKTVTGNATFNTSSYNAGTISGTGTFNGASKNIGTVSSNGVFHDTSSNFSSPEIGRIYGDAVFYESSSNGSIVYGNTTFYNFSYNNSRIDGIATFNDLSFNFGNINNNAIFNYASGGLITLNTGQIWGGTISGTIKGSDGVDITSWIFNGNSYISTGVVNGNVIFNDASYNRGTINGVATYNYATGGVITIATGGQWGSGTATSNVGIDDVPFTSWIFNGTSSNQGDFVGSAVFNDTSSNYFGITITGDTIFNNTGINRGIINGNVIFNSTSYNFSSGTITGSATFNTSSYNRGTITGSATFNNASYNRGTVTENATFYNTSTNGTDSFAATVSGNAKFFDTSVNHRTVTGNACFAPTASIHGGTVGGNTTICGVVPVSAIPSASLITLTSSTLNGEITDMGEEDASFRGFEYGLSDSYGTTITQSSGPYSTGVFTTDLIGLTCGTTYHYRTFATNTAGTGVSADATFVTSSCPSSGSSSGSMSTKAKALKNTIIPPTIPKTTPPVLTYNFGTTTLRKGSTGEAVKELQRFLNTKLNLGLIVDGKLGPKTILVIKKWQLDNGLVPDGLVGKKTKAKMNTN